MKCFEQRFISELSIRGFGSKSVSNLLFGLLLSYGGQVGMDAVLLTRSERVCFSERASKATRVLNAVEGFHLVLHIESFLQGFYVDFKSCSSLLDPFLLIALLFAENG